MELLLSLVLKWADESRVPLVDALARVTYGPGQRVATVAPGAGRLAPGQPADLCVFAPSAHWTVSAQQMRSAGHNTPFLGYEVPGRVGLTLVGGHVAHETLAV